MHNTLADPDAMETFTDHVQGNMICTGNSPPVHYGDSSGSPNIVTGFGAGECGFGVLQPDPGPPVSPLGPPRHVTVQSTTQPGYDLGGADGGVFTFGPPFFGSAANTPEFLPYAGIANGPRYGRGYYVANELGLVRAFGPNGRDFGSAAPFVLARPVIGIATAPGGDGYWEVADDGGVFASALAPLLRFRRELCISPSRS